ncbi:hypothetical protein [Desulfopila sp. IMCC35008]|uniref:hypothetical protein n=1 Tax=Desulfopila sp. IMCC35008 TaxID=2653858 RepID=UPI0013D384B6|nr:hypothetical protein [Desulfopila sp. IMCC35008]
MQYNPPVSVITGFLMAMVSIVVTAVTQQVNLRPFLIEPGPQKPPILLHMPSGTRPEKTCCPSPGQSPDNVPICIAELS